MCKCVHILRGINYEQRKTIYNRIIKRVLDVICSFIAIVFLSIVYLPICVVIKCTSKGPIFFKQKRIGKDKNILIYLNSEQ